MSLAVTAPRFQMPRFMSQGEPLHRYGASRATCLAADNWLYDDSSPAFDVTRRRFVPQRRRGDVDGRARSLLLVSRRGVLSQYVTNPVEH